MAAAKKSPTTNPEDVKVLTNAAAAMGKVGGKARMGNLSRKQRSELARQAANTRWRAWRKRNNSKPKQSKEKAMKP